MKKPIEDSVFEFVLGVAVGVYIVYGAYRFFRWVVG